GTTTQVLAGVQWAVAEGADVTSLSLGAGCGLFGGEVYIQAWIPVIENTKAAGTAFVASSGNGGACVGSPGNDFRSFAIGASNADGGIADFSSGDVVETSNWENPPEDWPDTFIKIGRASCREREWDAVVGVGVEEEREQGRRC